MYERRVASRASSKVDPLFASLSRYANRPQGIYDAQVSTKERCSLDRAAIFDTDREVILKNT